MMSSIEQSLVLEPGLAGTYMAPDEFDAIEESNELYVYELINGVLVVNPPPGLGERGPNEMLGHWLWKYHDEHPHGAALNYTVTEHTIRTQNRRRADRVIWAGMDRLPDLNRETPTVSIEFVSKGKRNRKRDFEFKRDEYKEVGVKEYWVIDRFDRQMKVFRFSQEEPMEIVIRENESYSTPLLPGFELSLAKLLAEADKVVSPDDSQ